ncbi:hypothetical protein TRVA0_054S00452 [Trichomonascus vanleenenianus]|uniref:uncharacterized protein n=1 Tax=Trichomonascus vanleenenianus TaxID=2268995 RepID=UPI003ECA0714
MLDDQCIIKDRSCRGLMQWYNPEIFRRSHTFGKWLPIACRDILELETFKAAYGYPCPDKLRIGSSPNVETVFLCRNHPINYVLVTGKCVAVDYSHYPDSGKYVYQYHIDDDTGPSVIALKECYFQLVGEEARIKNRYVEVRGYLMEKKGHSRKISVRGIRVLKTTRSNNSVLTPFRRYLLASLESLTVRQVVLSKNWADSEEVVESQLDVAEDPTHYCSLSRKPSLLESFRTFSESIVDDHVESRQEEDTINDADFDTAIELGYDFQQELVKLTQVPGGCQLSDDQASDISYESGTESSAVESFEDAKDRKESTLPVLGALAITSLTDPRLNDNRSMSEYAAYSKKLAPLLVRERNAKEKLGPERFEGVVINRFADKKLPAIGSLTYNVFNEPKRISVSAAGPGKEAMARLREKLRLQRSLANNGPTESLKRKRNIQKSSSSSEMGPSTPQSITSSSPETASSHLNLVVKSLRSFDTCSLGLERFLHLDEILSRSANQNPDSLFLTQLSKCCQSITRHRPRRELSSVRSFVIQVSNRVSQHLTDYIFKVTESDSQGRLYFTTDFIELFREVAFFLPMIQIAEENAVSDEQLSELISSVVRRFIINGSTEKVVTVTEIRKCIERKLESLAAKGYLKLDDSGIYRAV